MAEETTSFPSSCEISKGNFGINPESLDSTANDGLGFINREGKDMQIIKTIENGVPVFTFHYAPYTPPAISATVTPSTAEVGATVGTLEVPVNFHVKTTKGKDEIVLYTLTPDEPDVVVDTDFSFQKTAVTSGVAGLFPAYEMLVKDFSGTEVKTKFGVNFQHRYFQGYSFYDSLDATKIKALGNANLGANILSLWGGKKSYTTPNTAYLNYIYWVYPVGTAGINSAILSGLPFPTKRLADVVVTNQFGVQVTYAVVRSENKFGFTTLEISLS